MNRLKIFRIFICVFYLISFISFMLCLIFDSSNVFRIIGSTFLFIASVQAIILGIIIYKHKKK